MVNYSKLTVIAFFILLLPQIMIHWEVFSQCYRLARSDGIQGEVEVVGEFSRSWYTNPPVALAKRHAGKASEVLAVSRITLVSKCTHPTWFSSL